MIIDSLGIMYGRTYSKSKARINRVRMSILLVVS